MKKKVIAVNTANYAGKAPPSKARRPGPHQ